MVLQSQLQSGLSNLRIAVFFLFNASHFTYHNVVCVVLSAVAVAVGFVKHKLLLNLLFLQYDQLDTGLYLMV
jgi:hypothetical protein